MISVEVLSRPRGQRNRRDGAEEPRPGGTAEQVWVLAEPQSATPTYCFRDTVENTHHRQKWIACMRMAKRINNSVGRSAGGGSLSLPGGCSSFFFF
jgi:hypothetical protein